MQVRGAFVVLSGNSAGSAHHSAYLDRRRQMPAMSGPDGWCNLETDTMGTFLYAQDHDNNASTPLRCWPSLTES